MRYINTRLLLLLLLLMPIDVLGLIRLGVNSGCTPVSTKQNQYWEDNSAAAAAIRRGWTNLSAVLRREKTTPVANGLDAEGFAWAFSANLENVRSTTSAAPRTSII